MATLSDTYDEQLANIIRKGYADYAGSDRGNRWFQLHTADPTDVGDNRVTGVPRVAVARNEIQTLTITGSPTGGTLTITWNGQTTDPIAFDATAADVQAALEALSNVGEGNVICDDGPLPGSTVDIEFVKDLGQASQVLATADGSGLTGGTTPDASIAKTVDGFDLLGAYVDDATSGGRISSLASELQLTAAATAAETATHGSLWINESGTTSAEMVVSEALNSNVTYAVDQEVKLSASALSIFGAGAA